ncbi:MAG: TatD family hydrolase, partial [Steroidobacteraceae bacterium]
MEFIDIGINLSHESYRDDRSAVVERALAAGVRQMIVTGSSVESTRAGITLAQDRTGTLFATAGVHPHHASGLTAGDLQTLRTLAAHPEVVALGECGLDYYRDFSPRPAQREAFARQLEIAGDMGKPVFLHQRNAHTDFLAIVREYRGSLAGAVAHCFTGSAPELAAYLELGLHIGLTGWICDERRGAGLKALVRDIPADRLMIETDGPYMLPRDLAPRPA